MAIVTGDRYLERLVRFVEEQAGPLIDGSIVLKLNPAGLRYVQSRLEALHELENLLAGAPVDYLRAYVSDLGDHRALEQLRRILRLLTSLKVVSGLPHPTRDPTPLSLLPFGRLRVLELRGCDLSTSPARGLLELRHTLEKIICHNSSDALRHVFASRIVEIKDSPQWHRLSFVSCACNCLVLMDESLQLLPAVETLDLSRNKFAKLDNLRTCSKLKHLDLGFNHLRTISPFNEVSGNLVKLVLRNNALTTLHGLENLKSLEELDVSYNIISNLSEIEFISGLPTLHNLWLEGNPLCCAGWYRAHVFSYFPRLDKLKLDNKEISTRDFWKRQIIIARRQKHPASFGFYSPAKNDAEAEGNVMRKRRKVSRLASIESDEESTCVSSDHESASCDNEVQSKEEHVSSDDKAEIVDLINKVELMKKERSLLWLREFKDWMDHESENFVDGSSYLGPALHQLIEKRKHDAFEKHQGESSKCTANSFHASVSDTNTNVVESNGSFFDLSTSSCGEVPITGMERINSRHKYHKYSPHESFNISSEQVKASLDASSHQGGHRTFYNGSLSPLTAIDDRTESHSSFGQPGSPPHYVEDILQRRHNLVEEILQLSAESYSVVSSDSNTSSSEDENDMHEDRQSTCDYGWLLNFEYSNSSLEVHPSSHLVNYVNHDRRHQTDRVRENDEVFLCPHSEQRSCTLDKSTSYNYDYPAVSMHYEPVHDTKEQADGLERKENKRRLRRRLVSLSHDVVVERIILQNFNGSSCTCEAHLDSEQGMLNGDGSEFHEVTDRKQLWPGATKRQEKAIIGRIADDLIEEYFKENIADASANETCQLYMCCDCVLELESLYREREVALLLSTENKLYVLLIGVAFDGSGHILSLLDWHRMEDVREVLVGVGLQVIRVSIKRGATYLFPTRSIEKSRELLCILQLYGPSATNERCALRSLEQVQVELFEKEIFGGSKVSIFQYSLVLFHKKDREEESWHSRSLFVAGGHVHLCVEDLKHFSSSLGASLPEYFSLDSSCSISGVSELVIEVQSRCVTLVLEHAAAKSCLSSKAHKQRTVGKENKASVPTKALGPLTWKLKWYSEDNLLKFVAVMKAIHAGTSTSSLPVRYVL